MVINVIRTDRNSITRTALHWTPEGKRREAWQAKKHMEVYCRRRDEDHEQHLGYSRKDGQGQTEMEDGFVAAQNANAISGSKLLSKSGEFFTNFNLLGFILSYNYID